MVGGEGVHTVGRVHKVIVSAVLCASLGIQPNFKLSNGILAIGPHFIVDSFDFVHTKLQLLCLIIVCVILSTFSSMHCLNSTWSILPQYVHEWNEDPCVRQFLSARSSFSALALQTARRSSCFGIGQEIWPKSSPPTRAGYRASGAQS